MRSLTSIFDGSTWFGGASDAGKLKIQNVSNAMESVGEMLDAAINFHRNVYVSIVYTKNCIVANCDAAQKIIDKLLSMDLRSKQDNDDRDRAIGATVEQALKANSAIVSAAGAAISAGQVYPPDSDKDIPNFATHAQPLFQSALAGVRPQTPVANNSPSRGSAESQGQAAMQPKAADNPSERAPTRGSAVAQGQQESSSTPPVQQNPRHLVEAPKLMARRPTLRPRRLEQPRHPRTRCRPAHPA